MAALGKGTVDQELVTLRRHTKYMLAAVAALKGAEISTEDNGDTIVVKGNGGNVITCDEQLYFAIMPNSVKGFDHRGLFWSM